MKHTHGIAAWRREAPESAAPPSAGPFAAAVAIPARDEEALIERCLAALAAQDAAHPFAVVLFLNNCRDATADVVARVGDSLPFPLHVHEADLPKELANPAWARRLALNAAAALVGPGGALLSTDADSYAAPNWVRSCLADIDDGADIVCGFIAPDFSDAPVLDFETLRQGALEFEYSQLAAELVSRIDPDPADPWPLHQVESGANLAVRASVLHALGGIPHVCPGEDQAFVRAARRCGFRIRHDFTPLVTTSSRLQSRASGGWGEDLRARANNERGTCHEMLEPAAAICRRALLQAKLRPLFGTAEFTRRAGRLVSDTTAMGRIRQASSFEEAWGCLEDASPMLARRPLRRSRLEADLARLRTYLEGIGDIRETPRSTASTNTTGAARLSAGSQ